MVQALEREQYLKTKNEIDNIFVQSLRNTVSICVANSYICCCCLFYKNC